MADTVFIGAQEMAQILGCSVPKCYEIIRALNAELKKQGKIYIRGKTNRKYFMEKVNA